MYCGILEGDGLGASPLRSVGGRFNPAGVKRALALSCAYRLRFAVDHLLSGLRGVNFRAYRSSSRRLIKLSIQPKHKASSTASPYAIDGCPVPRL